MKNQELQEKLNAIGMVIESMKRDIKNRENYLNEDKLKLEALEKEAKDIESELKYDRTPVEGEDFKSE